MQNALLGKLAEERKRREALKRKHKELGQDQEQEQDKEQTRKVADAKAAAAAPEEAAAPVVKLPPAVEQKQDKQEKQEKKPEEPVAKQERPPPPKRQKRAPEEVVTDSHLRSAFKSVDEACSALRIAKFTVTKEELRGKDLLVAACDGGSARIRLQLMDLAFCYRHVWYPEMLPDGDVARKAARDPLNPEASLYALLIIFSVFCVCSEFRDHIRPLCDPERFANVEKFIRPYFDLFMMRRSTEGRFDAAQAKNDVPAFPTWVRFVTQLVNGVCANAHFVDPSPYPQETASRLTT